MPNPAMVRPSVDVVNGTGAIGGVMVLAFTVDRGGGGGACAAPAGAFSACTGAGFATSAPAGAATSVRISRATSSDDRGDESSPSQPVIVRTCSTGIDGALDARAFIAPTTIGAATTAAA